MNSYQVTGTILRKIPYGDSDWIMTILTESGLKMSALAKSARQSIKRFPGGIDLFNVFHFSIRPKSSDFVWLESSELVWGAEGARKDIVKFAAACYFAEIILEFVQDKDAMPHVYDRFFNFLRSLDNAEAMLPQIIPALEHEMLELFGFKPSLDRCVTCTEPVIPEKTYHFNGALGGVVCSFCEENKKNQDYPLSYSVISKMIQGYSSQEKQAGIWAAEEVSQARRALEYFLQYTAGKPFKSLQFLSTILT